MYCPECGKDVPDDAHFCPACGAGLNANAARVAATPGTVKKRTALWKKILMFIGGAVVLFVVWALWASSDMRPPVDRHLAALKAGDFQAAYDETSAEFREAMPLDAFTAFVQQTPILTQFADFSITTVSQSTSEGDFLGGTLTAADGAEVPVTFMLAKQEGDWKIVGYEFRELE